jgi:KDO2-lipid IV(A) lauroyltransferase
VTGQGIRVDYFGKEALVPDGYAVLARRFRATIIPTFLVMTEDGRYRFEMEEPIVPRITDDMAADIRDTVRRTLSTFEKRIRRHPEQWYVFRPVWDVPGAPVQDRHRRRIQRAIRRGRLSETAGRRPGRAKSRAGGSKRAESTGGGDAR